MKRCVLIIVSLICFSNCEKLKSLHKTPLRLRTTSTTTEAPPEENPDNKSIIFKTPNILKVPENIDIGLKKTFATYTIPVALIEEWATEISEKLIDVEKKVVRREFLLEKFKDIKRETRDGAAIVEKMAASLEDLLERRAQAAEAIGRKAEKLAAVETSLPSDYIFDNSIGLDELKKVPAPTESMWEKAENCSSVRRVPLKNLTHFNAMVELDITSVKTAAEVFDCDPRVLKHIYWSEGLLHVFRQNYAQDAMTDFQYFCSAKGFLRHYPAASWESMFKLKLNPDDEDEDGPADVYDCRLRPWYVAAGGAPRDIAILFDASGSMENSTNKIHAEQFTLTLLSSLTDDDHVNVIRFNENITSPIDCFNDKLVPANHVNSAAMMAALKGYEVEGETDMRKVLRDTVEMLQVEYHRKDKPRACQQAIILLTDAIEENFTDIMRDLDPKDRIRLFVIWLHDVYGLRDHSRVYGDWLACSSDGYFAELLTSADVTEQVMRVLQVLDRPLVHQRKERLRVFTDVYAHVEDPRRCDYYWRTKEDAEQAYRYRELRRNKKQFLSQERLYKDYMRHESLNLYGHYYEGPDLDYRLQISVSVPVFDDTRVENITIQLAEERQRNATRTYPVNRLLGVVGVDIPIKHLRLILPYYQLGAGGTLFIIDHRGNIVLHDNMKHTFDGDILKPSYRSVDLLELEQSAIDHPPRSYSRDWIEFRNAIVMEQPRGSREVYSKSIFEEGMRAILERREYHWRRVLNHYTVVVVLPKYNKQHAVPEGAFTQQLAAKAIGSFRSELSVHPDWLYCKHVDQHFDEPEFEVRHFVMRRMEEPNFKMQNLYHRFSPIRPTLLEKTYICNEELIARLCKEAMATEVWAEEHEDPEEGRECKACELGSVTAFFASESGLTRWQQYHMASAHAEPPQGSEWPRGPSEAWYKRAAAAAGKMVIHAPVIPIRKMRRTEISPPPLSIKDKWLTAARVLGHPEKGMIGVAGYHFYPEHLEDILGLTTNHPCPDEDEADCEPRCDGKDWSCVLIDEGGWIVAGHWPEEEPTEDDPAREHLARLYPHAMRALLDANVFKLHWVHDYQAVCFPPEKEKIIKKKKKSGAATLPSILKSLWRSVILMVHVTKELVTVLALISRGGLVAGDTDFEKEKRRRRIWKDYEREKYERLYDPRVMVNRTRFAACDRSRPLYELQRTQKAMETLRRPPKNCTWPLTGVPVPDTNLVLLAILSGSICPFIGRPVPDPLINLPVNMSEPEWGEMMSASTLACWRNRMPLPIRSPHLTCFPHNYTEERGYRQCGPWKPDPEVTESAQRIFAQSITGYLVTLLILLAHLFCHF